MSKYLLLFLGTFLSFNVFAQTGAIKGRVISSEGTPAEYASLFIKGLSGSRLASSTDTNGLYKIEKVPAGNFTLVVSGIGFIRQEKQFSLNAGEEIIIDFRLIAANQQLDEVRIIGEREIGYVAKAQSGATFSSRDLVDIPLSVSVITQEVLLDQQVRSLADLVRNDPSTIVSFPPGFNETVNIRGYNLDNSSSYRRENLIFQNQVQSPFENKAAVEIVKGPAAIRYGFTPPGGIINYILKRPTEEPYSFVQLFGDSNGSVGVHGDFGGKVNDRFGYRLNTVIAKEASYVSGISGPRQMFSAFLEWRPIDKLRIDIEAEYQYRELEQQDVIRLNSFAQTLTTDQKKQLLKNYDPRTFLGQKWGTYPTRNFVGSVGTEYKFNDNWSLYGKVQKMNLIRDQKAAGIVNRSLKLNGDFETEIYFNPSQVRDPLSTEAFLSGKFETLGIKHEISIGGAYSRNPLSFAADATGIVKFGSSNIFNPVSYPLPKVNSGPNVEALIFTQTGAFITDFISLTEKLEILAAVRYTAQKNEDVFNAQKTLQTSYEDNIILPNFGIIYSPLKDLNLYGSFSKGVTNGLQIPSQAANFGSDIFLEPVKTDQLEVGFKAKVFKDGLLTGAFFDIDQPLAFIDNDNVFRYGGSQRHRGAELSLAGQITSNFKIILGGLYLNPEIVNRTAPLLNGKRPASVPEWQGNFYVDYTIPKTNGLSFNAGVFYTGDRFADNFNDFNVDGYVRTDLGSRYSFDLFGSSFTARLNVRNISNKQFVEGLAFGSFVFGAPRTSTFSLAATF